MRALSFTLAIVFSHAVHAGDYQDNDGSWHQVIEPPAKYLNSVRISDVRIEFLPRARVRESCKWATGMPDQIGCANDIGSHCSVIVADDLPEDLRHAVLQHELAHCGPDVWPADHPVE